MEFRSRAEIWRGRQLYRKGRPWSPPEGSWRRYAVEDEAGSVIAQQLMEATELEGKDRVEVLAKGSWLAKEAGEYWGMKEPLGQG
jgi:hypothetical protein